VSMARKKKTFVSNSRPLLVLSMVKRDMLKNKFPSLFLTTLNYRSPFLRVSTVFAPLAARIG
jgi:hypothetical protein